MAEDVAAQARAIIEANAYMTLATADGEGLPWATPVWYAPESHLSLLWISRPEARHSVNLARRPELGIAIFDSRQPAGTGHGVYMGATATERSLPRHKWSPQKFPTICWPSTRPSSG